jgi:cytochrome c-type biogenesis protein CcmH/NrfF
VLFAADRSPQEIVEGGLMCHCGCTDLTVKTCSCGTAARIKQDIAQRLASGQTADQVVEAYVAQFGEQILSAPTRRGFNLLAWIVPFAAILAAGSLVVALTRRWAAQGKTVAAGSGAPQVPAGSGELSSLDQKRLDRIERDLRRDL